MHVEDDSWECERNCHPAGQGWLLLDKACIWVTLEGNWIAGNGHQMEIFEATDGHEGDRM